MTAAREAQSGQGVPIFRVWRTPLRRGFLFLLLVGTANAVILWLGLNSYAKMPVMTPNANTPNVMLATPIKVYFMSKVAARATMIFVMACSIDTRAKA